MIRSWSAPVAWKGYEPKGQQSKQQIRIWGFRRRIRLDVTTLGLFLLFFVPVFGQAGEFGTTDCDCDDVQPDEIPCDLQRSYGKCETDWMKKITEERPHGFCQTSCGRCPCPGAPIYAPLMPPQADGTCLCSDFPPKGSDLSCTEQKALGKCFAIWMRDASAYEEGFCAQTCGMCPCSNPNIRPGSPAVQQTGPPEQQQQPSLEKSPAINKEAETGGSDQADRETVTPVDKPDEISKTPDVEVIQAPPEGESLQKISSITVSSVEEDSSKNIDSKPQLPVEDRTTATPDIDPSPTQEVPAAQGVESRAVVSKDKGSITEATKGTKDESDVRVDRDQIPPLPAETSSRPSLSVSKTTTTSLTSSTPITVTSIMVDAPTDIGEEPDDDAAATTGTDSKGSAAASVNGGGCECSDFPPPGTGYSCEEQRQFGKCAELWMQSSSRYPEGYCAITCGRCPCDNPKLRRGSPLPGSAVLTSFITNELSSTDEGGIVEPKSEPKDTAVLSPLPAPPKTEPEIVVPELKMEEGTKSESAMVETFLRPPVETESSMSPTTETPAVESVPPIPREPIATGSDINRNTAGITTGPLLPIKGGIPGSAVPGKSDVVQESGLIKISTKASPVVKENFQGTNGGQQISLDPTTSTFVSNAFAPAEDKNATTDEVSVPLSKIPATEGTVTISSLTPPAPEVKISAQMKSEEDPIPEGPISVIRFAFEAPAPAVKVPVSRGEQQAAIPEGPISIVSLNSENPAPEVETPASREVQEESILVGPITITGLTQVEPSPEVETPASRTEPEETVPEGLITITGFTPQKSAPEVETPASGTEQEVSVPNSPIIITGLTQVEPAPKMETPASSEVQKEPIPMGPITITGLTLEEPSPEAETLASRTEPEETIPEGLITVAGLTSEEPVPEVETLVIRIEQEETVPEGPITITELTQVEPSSEVATPASRTDQEEPVPEGPIVITGLTQVEPSPEKETPASSEVQEEPIRVGPITITGLTLEEPVPEMETPASSEVQEEPIRVGPITITGFTQEEPASEMETPASRQVQEEPVPEGPIIITGLTQVEPVPEVEIPARRTEPEETVPEGLITITGLTLEEPAPELEIFTPMDEEKELIPEGPVTISVFTLEARGPEVEAPSSREEQKQLVPKGMPFKMSGLRLGETAPDVETPIPSTELNDPVGPISIFSSITNPPSTEVENVIPWGDADDDAEPVPEGPILISALIPSAPVPLLELRVAVNQEGLPQVQIPEPEEAASLDLAKSSPSAEVETPSGAITLTSADSQLSPLEPVPEDVESINEPDGKVELPVKEELPRSEPGQAFPQVPGEEDAKDEVPEGENPSSPITLTSIDAEVPETEPSSPEEEDAGPSNEATLLVSDPNTGGNGLEIDVPAVERPFPEPDAQIGILGPLSEKESQELEGKEQGMPESEGELVPLADNGGVIPEFPQAEPGEEQAVSLVELEQGARGVRNEIQDLSPEQEAIPSMGDDDSPLGEEQQEGSPVREDKEVHLITKGNAGGPEGELEVVDLPEVTSILDVDNLSGEPQVENSPEVTLIMSDEEGPDEKALGLPGVEPEESPEVTLIVADNEAPKQETLAPEADTPDVTLIMSDDEDSPGKEIDSIESPTPEGDFLDDISLVPETEGSQTRSVVTLEVEQKPVAEPDVEVEDVALALKEEGLLESQTDFGPEMEVARPPDAESKDEGLILQEQELGTLPAPDVGGDLADEVPVTGTLNEGATEGPVEESFQPAQEIPEQAVPLVEPNVEEGVFSVERGQAPDEGAISPPLPEFSDFQLPINAPEPETEPAPLTPLELPEGIPQTSPSPNQAARQSLPQGLPSLNVSTFEEPFFVSIEDISDYEDPLPDSDMQPPSELERVEEPEPVIPNLSGQPDQPVPSPLPESSSPSTRVPGFGGLDMMTLIADVQPDPMLERAEEPDVQVTDLGVPADDKIPAPARPGGTEGKRRRLQSIPSERFFKVYEQFTPWAPMPLLDWRSRAMHGRGLTQNSLDFNVVSAILGSQTIQGPREPTPSPQPSPPAPLPESLPPLPSNVIAPDSRLPCDTLRQFLESDTGRSQLSIVNTLMKKSGLLEELQDPDLRSTLFFPVDSAFSDMPKGVPLEWIINDDSVENLNFIRKTLLSNVVPQVITTDEFYDGLQLDTLYSAIAENATNDMGPISEPLTIKADGDNWILMGERNSTIGIPNIGLCGSVVHLVKKVVWPKDMDGFLPMVTGVRTCSTITQVLDNGAESGYSIITQLLMKAGLDEELMNPHLKATIFAPIDKAWKDLPGNYTIDRMLNDNSPETINELQKLLLFHVVAGRVPLTALQDDQTYVTFLGSFYTLVAGNGALKVERKGRRVFVSAGDVKAEIVSPDISACESVVHRIDSVLIPAWSEGVVNALLPKAGQEKRMPEESETNDQVPSDEAESTGGEPQVNKSTGSSGSAVGDDGAPSSLLGEYFGSNFELPTEFQPSGIDLLEG